jgi:hypothetical protein
MMAVTLLLSQQFVWNEPLPALVSRVITMTMTMTSKAAATTCLLLLCCFVNIYQGMVLVLPEHVPKEAALFSSASSVAALVPHAAASRAPSMDTLLVSHAASNATSMVDALVAHAASNATSMVDALVSHAASNATSMVDALVAALESNAASNAASMASLASIASSIADSIDAFLPVAKDAAAVAAAWTSFEHGTIAIDAIWLAGDFLGWIIFCLFVLLAPHWFKKMIVKWLMGIINKWMPGAGAAIFDGVNEAATAVAEQREGGSNGATFDGAGPLINNGETTSASTNSRDCNEVESTVPGGEIELVLVPTQTGGGNGVLNDLRSVVAEQT